MIIENISQWRTADLVSIVERLKAEPQFNTSGIGSQTMLLFKTSRKKEKEDRFSGEREIPPAATCAGWAARQQYEDTRVVLIRAPNKLQMDVLDRMAVADVQQDMGLDDMKVLVKAIIEAIGDWQSHKTDISWIKDMPLRIDPKPKRSKVVIEREVAAIHSEKRRIMYAARGACERLDKKIEKIRNRKTVD